MANNLTLYWGYQTYAIVSSNGVPYNRYDVEHYEGLLNPMFGAKGTFNCGLGGGVYTQGFNISASGYYLEDYYYNGNGPLYGARIQQNNNWYILGYVKSGTVTAAGVQRGGTSFLDIFNNNGNYGWDFWW